MQSLEKDKNANVDYLSKVFKGLPAEKQDNLLDTARELLKIQDNAAFPMVAPIPQKERQNGK